MNQPEKKILFIGAHRPNRNGSQRFRMEQFFPYFREQGFGCDYSWFIDAADDAVMYSPGKWFGKLLIFVKAIRIRLRDVMNANRYDIIFIQREAFMTGSVFFEKRFSKSKAKTIFDFDDSIWVDDVSEGNKKLRWLKRPQKTGEIIALCDLIFAGNNYLADYARLHNSNVMIVPTVVDTASYLPAQNSSIEKPVRIGWSGSKTTVKHFAPLIPVLEKLKSKFGERICFKQIGDRNFSVAGLKIESDDWHFENEVEELNKIDIGLMPLPDDEWAKGKCGFKALQYMALQIPAVVSPVGVNSDIVCNDVNGFHATSGEEWIEKISQLVESASLRARFGIAARKFVIENYSVVAYQTKITKAFHQLTSPSNRR